MDFSNIRRINHLVFAFIWLNLAAGCANLQEYRGAQIFEMTQSVEIAAPISDVFIFAANPINDHFWRTEVLEFKITEPLRVGSVHTESAAIGAVRGYMTSAKVTVLEEPTFLRVEALPAHNRRFIAERRFERLPGTVSRTRVIHRVLADRRIVVDLWPLPIPLGVAKVVYEARMRSNLIRLKNYLEATN